MKLTPISLLALLASCPGSPDVGQIWSDFESKIGLDFEDCGQRGAVDCTGAANESNPDADFHSTSACLLDAWEHCRPVTATLDWHHFFERPNASTRTIYIVPDDDDCRFVYFSNEQGNYSRFQCSELISKGACGVLEPSMCERVENYF